MTNIVLIGMPGCGKSTAGVLLAKTLGYSFLDTDLRLQQKAGKKLYEIIRDDGMEAFLQLENETVAALEDMEPGDLVQLSFDGQRFSHTPVVVAADHPKRLSDILVAAHSYDRDYWPLSRYEFTGIRFLHIIGVNRPVFLGN